MCPHFNFEGIGLEEPPRVTLNSPLEASVTLQMVIEVQDWGLSHDMFDDDAVKAVFIDYLIHF